jgi:hypothetical protein
MPSGLPGTITSGRQNGGQMLRKRRDGATSAGRMWRKPVTEQLAKELDASGSHKLAAVVREQLARQGGARERSRRAAV